MRICPLHLSELTLSKKKTKLIIFVILTAYHTPNLTLHNSTLYISLGLSADHFEYRSKTMPNLHNQFLVDRLHHYTLLHRTRCNTTFMTQTTSCKFCTCVNLYDFKVILWLQVQMTSIHHLKDSKGDSLHSIIS